MNHQFFFLKNEGQGVRNDFNTMMLFIGQSMNKIFEFSVFFFQNIFDKTEIKINYNNLEDNL